MSSLGQRLTHRDALGFLYNVEADTFRPAFRFGLGRVPIFLESRSGHLEGCNTGARSEKQPKGHYQTYLLPRGLARVPIAYSSWNIHCAPLVGALCIPLVRAWANALFASPSSPLAEGNRPSQHVGFRRILHERCHCISIPDVNYGLRHSRPRVGTHARTRTPTGARIVLSAGTNSIADRAFC